MVQDVPAVFEGTVEVDETYLGGQWKNKRHAVKVALASQNAAEGQQSSRFLVSCAGVEKYGQN